MYSAVIINNKNVFTKILCPKIVLAMLARKIGSNRHYRKGQQYSVLYYVRITAVSLIKLHT